MASSVKSAKWTADGAALKAPGGFEMKCFLEAPEVPNGRVCLGSPRTKASALSAFALEV